MKFVTDAMLQRNDRDLPSWRDRKNKGAEADHRVEAPRSPAAEVRRCFFRSGVTWVTLYEVRALVAATLLKDTSFFTRTPVPKVVCGLQFCVAESESDEVTVTWPSKDGGTVTLKFQKGFDYQVVDEKGDNVVFNVVR